MKKGQNIFPGSAIPTCGVTLTAFPPPLKDPVGAGCAPGCSASSAWARLLLEGKDQTPESPVPAVSFSDQGMTLSEKGETEFVPYSDFESAWETEDALLLVFGQRVTLLQKQDLVQGDVASLSRLLSEKVATYQFMD